MRLLPVFFVMLVLGLLAGCAGPAGSPVAKLDGGDESGLGGTGHGDDASGLGGTGLVGEITGFGSIFVNGVEVEIADDTRLSRNGVPLQQYDFAIGDVVVVSAGARGDMTVASSIRIDTVVAGPVQQVDLAERRFRVLGQQVQLGRREMTLPQVGQFVEVSGFRDGDARIHATRVAQTGPRQQVWLQGAVQVVDAGTVRIGRQLVDVDVAGASLENGDMLGVQGVVTAGRLRAGRLWPVPAAPFAPDVKVLRVQGFLQGSARDGYRIGGIDIESIDSVVAGARDGLVRLELRRAGDGWQAARRLRPEQLPTGRAQPVPKGPPGPVSVPMPTPTPPMRPVRPPRPALPIRGPGR